MGGEPDKGRARRGMGAVRQCLLVAGDPEAHMDAWACRCHVGCMLFSDLCRVCRLRGLACRSLLAGCSNTGSLTLARTGVPPVVW